MATIGALLLRGVHVKTRHLKNYPFPPLYKNVKGAAATPSPYSECLAGQIFYRTHSTNSLCVQICPRGSPRLEFSLKWPFCAYRLRKIDGGERMSKCVICDGDSIFGVQFLTENFSHYNGFQYADLEIFALFVRIHHDHPCLRLNNSKNLKAYPRNFFKNYTERRTV